ncbi:MAG: hypothetical protein KDB07_03250, partial [Planctomycetes bacterium]|nr:hypothetical protein [Planctomycetota bacterium]
MTLRSILSQSALMLAIFLPLSACSLLPTQENDEERIRLEKADELFTTAGTLYDKGDYNGAYNYARKAFEYDESIQSEMLMAWSLVNLKRFDDFTIPNTNVPAKGARSLFANIIKDSPNEFRALLG